MNRNARLRRSQSCTTPCGEEDHFKQDYPEDAIASRDEPESECTVRYRNFGADDIHDQDGPSFMGRRRCQSFDINKLREKVL
jgi:hypothetical protein